MNPKKYVVRIDHEGLHNQIYVARYDGNVFCFSIDNMIQYTAESYITENAIQWVFDEYEEAEKCFSCLHSYKEFIANHI